jgi:hypothetical protein
MKPMRLRGGRPAISPATRQSLASYPVVGARVVLVEAIGVARILVKNCLSFFLCDESEQS